MEASIIYSAKTYLTQCDVSSSFPTHVVLLRSLALVWLWGSANRLHYAHEENKKILHGAHDKIKLEMTNALSVSNGVNISEMELEALRL